MNSSKSPCVQAAGLSLKSFNLKYLLFLVLLMAGLPFHAFGQEATLLGTVTDPAGAIVPNVTITITSVETGRVVVVTTNESGQFVAPALLIGHYNVKAQATGFKVDEQQSISLKVGDRTRLDIQLTIGSTAESISVESSAITVQADTGEQSQVVTGNQISQLATNGRSIYTFVSLTTGASSLQPDFQTPTPVGGNGSVSFNGNRPAHNLYLLDGGEGDDRGGAGSFSIMPSIDALAETQTLTSNYSADYGLSSGGTIATVLKSGSKDFHASAWEYVRNNALNARPVFTLPTAQIPKLNFNTYGFNAGGPVTFGKLYNPERTKTFFFYNMEWRSLIQGGQLNQNVPGVDTYGGVLSGTTAAASLATLHSPYSCEVSPAIQTQFATAGQALSGCTLNAGTGVLEPDATKLVPFSYNGATGVINPTLLDPNAQALLTAGGKYGGIFPAATGLDNNGNPIFQGGNNSPTNVREEIVRIDHNFNSKFTIFGHFVAEQISQGYGTSQWSGDNVPTGANSFGNPSYSAVVHTAYVINPNVVNEASFNYNGNRIAILPTGLVTTPGFQFNRVFTGPNALDRIPSIQLNGTTDGTGSDYTTNWQPWNNKADDYQIRDDVSWTKGRHQIKIGGSWALYKKIQDVFTNTQGNFNFNGNFTGNDFADYLLGYAQGYSEDAVHDSGHWNNVSWAAYIQDNYRVNNRLTLNLGLRWDGVPHTYEANSRMSNFYPGLYNPANAAILDPTNPNNNTISPLSPGLGTSPNPILAGYQFYENGLGIDNQNGTPKGLVNNHWAAFGPRIGFAYDLTGQGKTVVRGGFGIMYERIQGNDVYNTGGNVPFSANASYNNVSLSNPNLNVSTGATTDPLALPIPVASITGIDKNYPLPASYQFSIGVQQALGAKTVLSVSYVGSQNRHQNDYRETDLADLGTLQGLIGTDTSNQVNTAYNTLLPYLGYHSIKQSYNEANGDYNSVQISARGTAFSDLTYQVGYTYSHTNDSFLGGGSGDLQAVSNPYLGWKYDYGPSPYDRRSIAFGNFVYNIPFLRHSENAILRTVVGGWEISGIVTIQSGAPINISEGGGITSFVPNTSNRPDLIGAIQYPHTVNEWFNPAAFAPAANGTWGNLAHNALRGPGRDNWNLSLLKNFVISESRGTNLQFRAECFNVWNHTQFQGDNNGGIDTNQSDSRFGAVTSAFDPRTFQLGMKFTF
jgi:Carboxypeptidase regulatory-like domain